MFEIHVAVYTKTWYIEVYHSSHSCMDVWSEGYVRQVPVIYFSEPILFDEHKIEYLYLLLKKYYKDGETFTCYVGPRSEFYYNPDWTKEFTDSLNNVWWPLGKFVPTDIKNNTHYEVSFIDSGQYKLKKSIRFEEYINCEDSYVDLKKNVEICKKFNIFVRNSVYSSLFKKAQEDLSEFVDNYQGNFCNICYNEAIQIIGLDDKILPCIANSKHPFIVLMKELTDLGFEFKYKDSILKQGILDYETCHKFELIYNYFGIYYRKQEYFDKTTKPFMPFDDPVRLINLAYNILYPYHCKDQDPLSEVDSLLGLKDNPTDFDLEEILAKIEEDHIYNVTISELEKKINGNSEKLNKVFNEFY